MTYVIVQDPTTRATYPEDALNLIFVVLSHKYLKIKLQLLKYQNVN
jgi:hypothetical protein